MNSKNNLSRNSVNTPDVKGMLEMMIHSSADIIAVLDKDLNYTLVNKKAQELYGGAEIIGKNILELFPQVKDSGMYSDLQKALTGDTVRNSSYRTIHGRYYDNFYTPLKNDEGQITGVMVIGHDNTEIIETALTLKKNIEELRKSEERYHMMTNEVEDYAIILLSENGIIENWNKGAEKIKGYKAHEIIGQDFRIFYPTQDRKNGLPDRLIQEAREKGKAYGEGWRVRKDGTTFWGSIVITGLRDSNGEITGFSKVTRDLTERKLMEDRLKNYAEELEQKNIKLERTNAELSSFSYVASHDLQEPLRKIKAFGKMIIDKEAANLTDNGRNYFARMVSAADRMQNLIEALLEFSRATSVHKNFELTDLNIMVEDLKKDLQEQLESKKAVIHVTKLPQVSVISYQFRQMLSNIINNSLKYAHKDVNPVIDICSSTVTSDQFPDRKLAPGIEYVELTIKDNGIGFEQEHAAKIFELFYRLHGKSEYTGSGIGLAICAKIIENHNGFITAESQPGQGAAFHIFLPKVAPK